MKTNVRGIDTSSKPVQAGPGASRPLAKRGGGSVGGARKNASAMGAGGKHSSRHGSGSALANPLPRSEAASKELTPAALVAPVTITVSGRVAAMLRFVAYHNGRTPQEEGEAIFIGSLRSDLANGIGHNDSSAEEWLTAGAL